MSRIATMVGGMAILFGGVSPGAAPDIPEVDEVALDRSLDAWESAFNAHDANAVAATYAEDAEVVFATGERVRGRAGIAEGLAKMFAENPGVRTNATVLSRRALGPELVVEDGLWQEWGHTQDGLATEGLYTAIIAKRQGTWLVVHEVGYVHDYRGPSEELLKELDGHLVAWDKAYNEHDAEALASRYDDDACLMLISGDRFEGRSAIEQGFAAYFARNPDAEVKDTVISRRFLSPTLVVEDGRWEESGLGEADLPTTGLYTVVLVKKQGKWLVVSERGYDQSGDDETASRGGV